MIEWIIAMSILISSLAFATLAVVMLLDWRESRRLRVIEALDRSRKALMDMEPITVRIGTPLYDQEKEEKK